MFSSTIMAAIVPFLLAGAQASAVGVTQDLAAATQASLLGLSSEAQKIASAWPCKPDYDGECYKKYYDEYAYCHPYDRKCYKDCDDYDEYKNHCYHKDYDYPCYDKCYYDHRECRKWDDCHDSDYDCYKKKHHDYYNKCDYHDEDCYKNKDPYYKEPHDDNYCKPWDWDCHKKYHKDHDYECDPYKDKHCYPYYYPEPTCPDKGDDYHKEPNNDIIVKYFGPYGTYTQKVWPDGDEAWTEKNDFVVDHIKYYAEKEDEDIRCLPMLSYFPWTPLPLERYIEKTEDHDYKVRVLRLKKPQPVELIRCDFP